MKAGGTTLSGARAATVALPVAITASKDTLVGCMRLNEGLASMVGPLRMEVGVSVGGGRSVSQAARAIKKAVLSAEY